MVHTTRQESPTVDYARCLRDFRDANSRLWRIRLAIKETSGHLLHVQLAKPAGHRHGSETQNTDEFLLMHGEDQQGQEVDLFWLGRAQIRRCRARPEQARAAVAMDRSRVSSTRFLKDKTRMQRKEII